MQDSNWKPYEERETLIKENMWGNVKANITAYLVTTFYFLPD